MKVWEVEAYMNSDEQTSVGIYATRELAEQVQAELNSLFGERSGIGVWVTEREVLVAAEIPAEPYAFFRREFWIRETKK